MIQRIKCLIFGHVYSYSHPNMEECILCFNIKFLESKSDNCDCEEPTNG